METILVTLCMIRAKWEGTCFSVSWRENLLHFPADKCDSQKQEWEQMMTSRFFVIVECPNSRRHQWFNVRNVRIGFTVPVKMYLRLQWMIPLQSGFARHAPNNSITLTTHIQLKHFYSNLLRTIIYHNNSNMYRTKFYNNDDYDCMSLVRRC